VSDERTGAHPVYLHLSWYRSRMSYGGATLKLEFHMNPTDLKIMLLSLIVAIQNNEEATDDDLAETWEDLKRQSAEAEEQLREYIKRGES
jgi:hypothetical protein